MPCTGVSLTDRGLQQLTGGIGPGQGGDPTPAIAVMAVAHHVATAQITLDAAAAGRFRHHHQVFIHASCSGGLDPV